jgi:hypothetical protein
MLKRLALIAALLASPAEAATATYIVNLGGANIANLTVDLKEEGSRYTLDLKATIVGLGQLVANGIGSIQSTGRIGSKSYESEYFAMLTRAGGEDFTVDIGIAGGNVDRFVVEPPIVNNIDRIALERKHLRGVNDMLAALILRGGRLDRSLCSRSMKIFTGLERFDLDLKFIQDDVATSKRTGYTGPVVLCGIRYKPVSGHFTTSDMTIYLTQSDRIHIWYMPLAEDSRTFIPYRVLIATAYGDLSMVLTKLAE